MPAACVHTAQKPAILLDVGGVLDWTGRNMKTKFFAAFVGLLIVATGCINTVSGTKKAAVPFLKDRVDGRYLRTMDQVYQASVQVIQNSGVVITEFIPHDTTNVVRSLQGKVNQRNVWVRVQAVDPRTTEVTVQARTRAGGRDIELAHELEKEIALQLAR
jgi:hypothetical protein